MKSIVFATFMKSFVFITEVRRPLLVYCKNQFLFFLTLTHRLKAITQLYAEKIPFKLKMKIKAGVILK